MKPHDYCTEMKCALLIYLYGLRGKHTITFCIKFDHVDNSKVCLYGDTSVSVLTIENKDL